MKGWTENGNYCTIWGFPNIRGTFFGGPHNKDYSIWGSTLGSPYFGKQPFRDEGLGWFVNREGELPFRLQGLGWLVRNEGMEVEIKLAFRVIGFRVVSRE